MVYPEFGLAPGGDEKLTFRVCLWDSMSGMLYFRSNTNNIYIYIGLYTCLCYVSIAAQLYE